jgi:hypothetical protein
MKNHLQEINVVRSSRFFTFLLVAVAAAACAISNINAGNYPDANPDGSINTGNASIFAVLTNGDFEANQNASVTGNVGVGGTGNFHIHDNATVNGNLYMNSHGQIQEDGNPPHIVTGQTLKNQDAVLNKALADAMSLSNAAAAETVTPAYKSLTNVNLNNGSNITVTGAANQKIVLSLQNFQLDNSSTFTLSGTATTTFIINDTGNLSLNNNSKITLIGVSARNVLFNLVHGNAEIQNGSQAFGTILALNGEVHVHNNGAKVTGRIIAQKVHIENTASVVTPTQNQ